MSSLLSLPDDIRVEILSKLPMESILTCKCVCKSWRTSLSSNKFTRYYLNHSIKTNHKPRFLFTDIGEQENRTKSKIYSLDYSSISPSALSTLISDSFLSLDRKHHCISTKQLICNGAVPMDYIPLEDKTNGDRIQLLGSCDGLICLLLGKLEHICIWNPTTREYKEITTPQGFFSSSSEFRVLYGFGYDANIDDYKLVRISPLSDYSKVDVYTLISDSWKCVPVIWKFVPSINTSRLLDGEEGSYFRTENVDYQGSYPGVYINGAFHWPGIVNNSEGKVILSFNISDESFLDVPYPKEVPEDEDSPFNAGVLGDYLCLVSTRWESDSRKLTGSDVWVMQDYGAQESWTKLLTFNDTEISTSQYAFCEREWSLGDGWTTTKRYHDLIFCDATNGIRIIPGDDATGQIYVESLVSLNSGTYTQTKNMKVMKE